MMPAPGVRALAIARPVWLGLSTQPFSGRVVSRFERACNLMDREGRIIALTGPSIGKGPFCIVLHAARDLFDHLQPQQRTYIDAHTIILGDCCIPLRDAPVWDATLPPIGRPLDLRPPLAALLRPYTTWPPSWSRTSVDVTTARLLAQGAHSLMAAVERRIGLAAAAQQLAGLGPGLTPAGDDYVLGVMAALWLLGERDPLPAMAAACATRTTLLSGAFLRAAAQGQFMEGWHHLAHALDRQDEPGSRHAAGSRGERQRAEAHGAVRHIAAFGASSGRDSLAGFACVLLHHAHA
jgi:Protein of unknown function (DUF2877)